ncbi:uncharacterized protein DS421_8g245540 [Arachis hypogaea]|nr:uncharacterized protein DS421_8g245540 [Arachis hypogaea]
MTQKSNLFKGQKKNKSVPPNRHGKAPSVRKGKRFVKPSKLTKEMDADRVFRQAKIFGMGVRHLASEISVFFFKFFPLAFSRIVLA